jgi:uncharacterized protein
MLIRLLIAAIPLALQAFLFRRFWKWSGTRPGFAHWSRMPVLVAFVVFDLALIVVAILRIRSMQFPDWFLFAGAYPFLIWHFSTFVIALALLAGYLLTLPFKGAWAGLQLIPAFKPRAAAISTHPVVRRFDRSRRTFLRRGVYGLTAVSFGGTAYGMLVERSACEATEKTIFIPGLPSAFSGYSIGLVTDVHSSLYMTASDMRDYVRVLNGMGTDLVLVGGDLVNSMGDEVLPFADAFSGTRAPDGVFGVLGNHDFYSREPDRVAEVATSGGVRILRDESHVIRRGDASLTLLGIDDTGNASSALERISRAGTGTDENSTKLLLCHRPYFLPEAAHKGIHLMLSGHTHGGQVVLGRFADMTITPAAVASPYIAGLYKEGASQMYVSRGIGTVGIPIRINCPPELTRIILKPA